MNITIIGIGLIGGSLAKSLKNRMNCRILGVDNNTVHCNLAIEHQIVDEIVTMETGIKAADIIFISIPVSATKELLPEILDSIDDTTIVIEMGSTKFDLCDSIKDHKNRKNLIAAHPIAGTENNGPLAAFDGLYDNKLIIICEKEKSSDDAQKKAMDLFSILNMKPIYLDPEEHDRQLAYVSHLSHISSFTLGLTVLDMEKDDATIFNLAGSGFASTVRLAKSSPEMWSPIFVQNSKHIINALNCYINELERFRNLIEQKREQHLKELMKDANEIRRILDGEHRTH